MPPFLVDIYTTTYIQVSVFITVRTGNRVALSFLAITSEGGFIEIQSNREIHMPIVSLKVMSIFGDTDEAISRIAPIRIELEWLHFPMPHGRHIQFDAH
jgi:hypothetical protein